MTAYTPHSPMVILALLLIGTAMFLIGWAFNRCRASSIHRLFAWCLPVATVFGIERLTAAEPTGVRMIAIILVLLCSMKLVVITSSRLDGGPTLSTARWFCFLFGWPGMQPSIFAKPLKPHRIAALQLFQQGSLRIVIGLGLMFAARNLLISSADHALHDVPSVAATLLLLIGVSLVLHFGVFNLLAAGWQAVGVNCQPLFGAPLASISLSEFWSRRWNLAFSEMTALAVYRPCQKRCGPLAALFAGFVFSGAVHELAITVPVRSGYGGPFGYFLIHGALVLIERRLDLPRRWGNWYRLWMLLWLIVPLPWLFPPAFLRDIVWPLVGVVR